MGRTQRHAAGLHALVAEDARLQAKSCGAHAAARSGIAVHASVADKQQKHVHSARARADTKAQHLEFERKSMYIRPARAQTQKHNILNSRG